MVMHSIPGRKHPDRDARQRSLVPPGRLAACHALVIGVGAIGQQVALQLAALGVPELTLFDDDVVAEENLAPQGYWASDLGQAKVQATQALCRQIHPQAQVTAVAERFKRSTAKELTRTKQLVVCACVDSISTRKLLWEALRYQAALFLDGRLSAEVIRVLAVDHAATDDSYTGTLFDAEQAYAGACTARSTIYTASIAAGLMVGQLTKWLRRLPVDADLTLNLLAAELTVLNQPVAP
jgi:sulfur carrier protein ThiS adenylyltransferase